MESSASQTIPTDRRNNIHTYRRIRKTIGYLAFFLPVALIVFSLIPFFETSVQPSISKYYYTNLRELFTGVLFAVGLFLIRYEGFKSSKFWRNDNLLTNIAGYMAFGVALIPGHPYSWDDKIYTLIPVNHDIMGWIHYGFAAMFFTILSFLSIWVFPIGQEENSLPKTLFNEIYIYKFCGFAMLGMIILIPVFSVFEWFEYSTLLFEALILFFFGISWLIKGRALGDKGIIGESIYREKNKPKK